MDKNRIGALGICGGGGYTFAAAQSDKRLNAIATVSLFNTGLVRRNGLGDSQIATVQERLAQAAKARTDEANGKIEYAANADLTKITPPTLSKCPPVYTRRVSSITASPITTPTARRAAP